MTSDEGDRLFEMGWVFSNAPVGPTQVLAPGGTESHSRRFGFGESIVHGPVAAHFTRREVAEANGQANSNMPRNRAAKTDFEIVGVGPEDKEINGHHNTLDHGQERRERQDGQERSPSCPSSPSCLSEPENLVSRLDLVQVIAEKNAAGQVRPGEAVTRITKCEQMIGIVSMRADVR
jgi:hypothetical protein